MGKELQFRGLDEKRENGTNTVVLWTLLGFLFFPHPQIFPL